MVCADCGTQNTAEDSRCTLCGRRLTGPVLVAEGYGNTAPRLDTLEQKLVREDTRSRQQRQAKLFPTQEPKRVIPFSSISPDAAKVARSTQERNAKTRVRQQYSDRIGLNPDDDPEIQKELEFPEDKLAPRVVERVIYSNAPVAMPGHRAMAVAYDLAMVLIGVGLLLGIYYFGGVRLGLDKLDLSTYGVVTLSVAFFYKILWALSGGDTPGMGALKLRLVNFDGQRPSREERVLRVLVSIVSFASLGLGLAWCLFDEEKLTWHDHITKTFSTPKIED